MKLLYNIHLFKGFEVFRKCTFLSMAILDDGLKVLGAKMFANSGLTVVTISSKIVSFGKDTLLLNFIIFLNYLLF